MRLGAKTVLMTGSAIAVLFAALGAVSWHVVLSGFAELEDVYAYRNVERVRGAIKDRQAGLLTAVTDWTTWDDLYRFAADRNQVFVKENLNVTALAALKIQYLSLTDPAHAPIWSGMLSADGTAFSAAPAALTSLTDRVSPMTSFGDAHVSGEGIVDVGGRLMLVASRPVLTSAGTGPSHGTLLMGRFLGAEEIAEISASLRMDVSLSAASLFSGRSFLERLSRGDVIRKERRDVMNGYGILRDVFGAPVAVLSVTVPRDIFAQGMRTGRIFGAVLAGVGLVFILLLSQFLHRVVLRRMEQEQFKLVLEEMGDAVIVCDDAWTVCDINRSARQLFGDMLDVQVNVLPRLYSWFDVSVTRETLASCGATQLRFDAVRKKALPSKAQYIEAVLNVIADPSGTGCRRLLVIRDVSAIRQEDIVRQDLLGTVAHELSLPVCEIAAEVVRMQSADTHASASAAIARHSKSLKVLIEKLLMFTEAMSAHRAMLADAIVLQPYFLSRAQKLFDVGRSVEIKVRCDDAELAVKASRMAFDLIVDSLIDNAVRFGDKDPTVIELAAVRDGETAVITVSDNGPGISIEDMARAFPGSAQGVRQLVGRDFGAGVILALAKRLVDANDGTFAINSLEGSGTTFTMSFLADNKKT